MVVDDLEAQRTFWGEMLGVPEDHAGPGFAHFIMPTGEIFEVIERSEIPEYNGRRFQVGFEVWPTSMAPARSSSDVASHRSAKSWALTHPTRGPTSWIQKETCLRSSSASRPLPDPDIAFMWSSGSASHARSCRP